MRHALHVGTVRGTSARAERTQAHPSPSTPGTGYLRSRGEDGPASTGAVRLVGVPPLARRGPRPQVTARVPERGTSARAERTSSWTPPPAGTAGYLRSRGEDCTQTDRRGRPCGVPPLARRGHLRPHLALPGLRGTSARAERTNEPLVVAGTRAGYLRSRGEDTATCQVVMGWSGVPPLARRGRPDHHHARRLERGTSARAERTSRPSPWP